MEAAVGILAGGQLGDHAAMVAAEDVVAAEGPVEGKAAFQHEGDGAVTVLGGQLPTGHQNRYANAGSGRRRW